MTRKSFKQHMHPATSFFEVSSIYISVKNRCDVSSPGIFFTFFSSFRPISVGTMPYIGSPGPKREPIRLTTRQVRHLHRQHWWSTGYQFQLVGGPKRRRCRLVPQHRLIGRSQPAPTQSPTPIPTAKKLKWSITTLLGTWWR